MKNGGEKCEVREGGVPVTMKLIDYHYQRQPGRED